MQQVERGRPAPAAMATLALLYAVGGTGAVLGALVSRLDDTVNPIGAAAGPLILVVAAVTWLLRRRGSWASVHALIAVAVAAPVSMIAIARTPEGAVTTSVSLVCVAMIAASFFSLTTARRYAAVTVVSLATAMVTNGQPHMPMAALVVAASIVAVTEVLGRQVARLREALVTDSLTGALNRSGLEQALVRLLPSIERGEALTVVTIDLDGFKEVNDSVGHAAGDDLLQRLVGAWRDFLPPSTRIARLGGDEFVLVMPDTTAEQCDVLLTGLRHTHPARWTVGVAQAEPGDTPTGVVGRADLRLVAAKRTMRRRAADRAGEPVPDGRRA